MVRDPPLLYPDPGGPVPYLDFAPQAIILLRGCPVWAAVVFTLPTRWGWLTRTAYAALATAYSAVDRKERLLQLVGQLQEPHKSIFNRYFFDEEPLCLIGGAMDMDEEQTQKSYEEAVDQLKKLATKSNIH